MSSYLLVKGTKGKQMKFTDDPRTMVITTKRILENKADIVYVSHDEEDGMWQFLDGYENDENNAVIISLEEMVSVDGSIEQIADLSLGWVAWREVRKSAWIRKKR